MNRRILVLLCLLSAAAVLSPKIRAGETLPSAAELKAAGVVTFTGEWTDSARDNRVIPWRAYLPAKSEKPVPIVIVSHGLGGSRDGMGYLGQALASQGIVTVHIQHAGSDESVWKGKAVLRAAVDMKAAMSFENATLRRDDVEFALVELERFAARGSKSPFAGKIDTTRAGVAGHSFGALTALQTVGMKAAGDKAPTDARFKAALVLSPPAPPVDLPAVYDGITVPVFIFTGTKDEGVGIGNAVDRLKNFANIRHANAWQVVFDGGDHMVYSGNETRRSAPEAKAKYPVWRAGVCDLAVALFRSELLGDKAAAAKLSKDAVIARVGKLGEVSVKP